MIEPNFLTIKKIIEDMLRYVKANRRIGSDCYLGNYVFKVYFYAVYVGVIEPETGKVGHGCWLRFATKGLSLSEEWTYDLHRHTEDLDGLAQALEREFLLDRLAGL